MTTMGLDQRAVWCSYHSPLPLLLLPLIYYYYWLLTLLLLLLLIFSIVALVALEI